jgi:HEAT repeat protein
VEYIARGQIKTLAVYDVAPGLSIAQIYKAADWYEKAQKFQRAVAKGDEPLEQTVDAFLQALAEPYEPVTSGAAIDLDVAGEWQYEATSNQRGG